MKKKLLSIMLCLSTTLVSSAAPLWALAEETETALSADMEESSHYPLTLTDQAGREVTIEAEPSRLISSYYITTSTLMALGLNDKIVGIEDHAEKRPVYQLSDPELLALPSVGSVKEFDLEGCAALEPDLVILPMKLQNTVEALESLGLTVLLVNPESQELLSEMISLIAEATNTEDTANELLTFINTQEEFLTETIADADKPRVYLSGNSNMLSTAGNAMYQSDMIRLAGGENVAAELTDTYWSEISYEQLLAWDPEYIIMASSASYTREDVLSDPNLANCTAVKNGTVYHIPDTAESWDSPVPGSILGSIWLSNILHPDLVSEEDCTSIIDEYYETFYHFIYSEN